MKTIELMISGQKAQFTTKSVTIDGKEYFYSNMTKLDHSPIVHTYRFEYSDGDAKLLTYDKKDTKIMAAIFSQVHKMLEGKKATIYPGMEEHLAGAQPAQGRVVKDENIITSQGPGTAMDFALAIVEEFCGAQVAEDLRKDLILK